MMTNRLTPDYLFEVSWEVCNKIGGTHTAMATKSQNMVRRFEGQYICIGPDVWRRADVNPEFEEDPDLFPKWKKAAALSGLHVRTGWWAVPGKPIVILVDFTRFIDQKDAILTSFWEDYNLDSLTGQWEYIEPVLFGYAAGKIIEHFTDFFGARQNGFIAHFHEWKSSAGLLYLKKYCPESGTVLTNHGTELGRKLAAVDQGMENIDPEAKAQEFKIRARHSLESISAREADVFTTVSPVTERECELLLGVKPDLVTPNGFDMDLVQNKTSESGKSETRKQLKAVAEAVLGTEINNDPFLIATSGRYEFKNKGLDVLIEGLKILNEDPEFDTPVLAFLFIPSAQHGPKSRVRRNLDGGEIRVPGDQYGRYLTHYLIDQENDRIISSLIAAGLHNHPDQKVKVFFIPAYLDGNDGIINKRYYDVFSGFDLTVFPSRYEPWGYTPLESLALQVPSVTTDYSGFGHWIRDRYTDAHPALEILPRTTLSAEETARQISEEIKKFVHLPADQKEIIASNAVAVASTALWDLQIKYYNKAYELAMEKIKDRPADDSDVLTGSLSDDYIPVEPQVNEPSWTRLIVQASIPDSLSPLEILSKNLWWCWNSGAIELFRSVDPDLWESVAGNPVELLQKVNFSRWSQLEKDTGFRERMHQILYEFDLYMQEKKSDREGNPIAYFSMEYGLHSSLQLYSGGLGVLAGDYLKQASDENVHMVAVGLLYRFGYFSQRISAGGQQLAAYDHQNFNLSAAQPVRDEQGTWLSVPVVFPGRTVRARIWKVAVGRTDLYLLDTDFEENQEQDRALTYHLYGGDLEHRLKQEVLLGVGGIRALDVLGIDPVLYHLNEGHAAFVGVERLAQLIEQHNLSYQQAREVVRSSSVFTTHTPVPAGHDVFPEDLMRVYLGHMAQKLRMDWSHFMFLGSGMKSSPGHSFSMSVLASRLSDEINGVSMLHGKVSQKMFADLFPGYFPEENHISYVTNGVHYPTWTDQAWRSLLEEKENPGFPDFERVRSMKDQEIWEIRRKLRRRLYELILRRTESKAIADYESPSYMTEVRRKLNPDALIVGFARRFATYKRAGLLFRNEERLERLVNHPERPVVFIYAGKAHPHDVEGQQLIKDIVHLSKKPQFVGKIIFLQNYDMDLAKYLVSGVDVWLNTPTRPLEASGTSGMKVVMNGGLHFSVLDGWWVEGYQPGAGWALSLDRTYLDQELQNELDAENIYSLFEGEISQAFFDRDEAGVPQQWIEYIRKSMTEIAPQFTSHRMIEDYTERFYDPLRKKSKIFSENHFYEARHFTQWKKDMMKAWDSIRIVDYELIDVGQSPVITGNRYHRRLVLDLGGISPDNIGVELVVSEEKDGVRSIIYHIEYKKVESEGSVVTYQLSYTPVLPGTFDIGTRIYGKYDGLIHRSRLPLVRWL